MPYKLNGCGNKKKCRASPAFSYTEYVNHVTLKITFIWPVTSPLVCAFILSKLVWLRIIKHLLNIHSILIQLLS